jgi:tetratricopeptide (TPR) repeat protein
LSKILFSLVILLLLLSACAVQTVSGEQMATANRLYEAGQFAEAAAAYQSLADSGVRDGDLYYNLGNAYFKAGDVGRAIVNYRRAQQLLPRDADIAANLQLARAQTVDRLKGEDEGAVIGLLRRLLISSTTLNEMAGITLGLWSVVCLLGIALLLLPRYRRALGWSIAVAAALLVVGMLSIGLRLVEERQPSAVMTTQEIPVRSGPGTDYLNEFTLHAGAEVQVIESRAAWMRIVLPGNLQGWVPADTLELVNEFGHR